MQLTGLTTQRYNVDQSVHKQFVVRIFHRRAVERRQDHVQNFATYTLVNAQIGNHYTARLVEMEIFIVKFF